MVTARTRPEGLALLFVGNHPALDFLNTAPFEHGVPVERLVDYDVLVTWLERATLVSPDDARESRSRWRASSEGETAVSRALSLRKALADVVERTWKTGSPSAASITRLNAELRSERGAYFEVGHGGGGFTHDVRLRLESAEDVLAPLFRAVATFLAEVDFSRIRKCEDEACVLFFYDTSKNNARRWCSMDTCGNRNKVSAYRARTGRAG